MTNDLSEQARASFREFVRFYGNLIDTYVRALHQEGISSDRKLTYARDRGTTRLVELSERVTGMSVQQTEQFRKVLVGYRQIAASTTSLCGIGSLLVRLPEDAALRLVRLQLL